MATLTGKQIANSYKQLLQIGSNNTGVSVALQTVQDGNGSNTALQLSNSTVNVNGTFALNGVNLTADASALNAITDLTGITGIVAMNAGSALGRTLTAGAGITISNADGTEGNPTIAVSLEDTTINVAKVSASIATFNSIVSAGFFVGDGSGLINVPSAEGGTVKFIEAGTGIKITVDGAVSSSIPVSGTILVSADQNFGTVSVSTALAVTGSALFDVVSATSYYGDGSNLTGVTQTSVSNYTVNQLTVVSAASFPDDATLNFGTGNDLQIVHNGLNSVIKESGTGSLFVQSNEIKLTNTGSFSMLTLADGQDAVFPYGIQVSGTVSATSFVGPTITSINSVISNVSALTSVNSAAITSINTVVDNLDFATSAELATVSAALATSISNTNSAVTSVNTVITNLSATLATSINNSNTSIAANAAAITSVNTVITNLSATLATSIGNTNSAVTSVNTVITNLSATLATSIANHLPLAGGTLTGTVSGTDFYVSAVAIGVDALLGKELRIGTAAVADIVSLTDAASIAVDFNTGQNFAITLAGNRTLENPTNCVAGQVGSIFIVQDGTGSRTLAFGSNWDFPDGTAPVISTSINAVDRLDYIVHTSTDVHGLVTKAYS